MKRNSEIKYLIPILLIIYLGFFLTYLSFFDRNVPYILVTGNCILDVSHYFLAIFPNALYGPMFVTLFLLLHLFLRIKLPRTDPFILPSVALLSGIGAVMIFRLSPDIAISRNDAIQSILSSNPTANVRDNVLTLAQLGMKQMIFIVSGSLVMLTSIYFFNKRTFSWLSSKKYLWVFISSVLIFTTLLFGEAINARKLWLFGFQTVELVKVLMFFFIAGYIYEKGRGITTYRGEGFKSWVHYSGPFVVMWFFAVIPLLIQRDLGPTFLIFIVFLLMFFYAGSPNRIIVLFVFMIIACGYISYKSGFPSIVHERFEMMFYPFEKSESMSRALWSISSGGLFGSGIGYGQPYQIPIVQSDYNFSAICEEMGFIGAIAVICVYTIMLYRYYRISSETNSIYKKTLVAGIGILTGLQVLIIICGNLGAIPMTGITLPFISYGGSSIVINFLMNGIVLRISGGKDA